MDLQAKKAKSGEIYVLVVQDIFSRFLWARALTSKTQVGTAFLRLMEDTGRACKELNSDFGSEFSNAAFKRMLYFNGDIRHRFKEGLRTSPHLTEPSGLCARHWCCAQLKAENGHRSSKQRWTQSTTAITRPWT